MNPARFDIKPLCVALLAAGVLSACGGGGGGDTVAPATGGSTTPGSATPGTTTPGDTTTPTTPTTNAPLPAAVGTASMAMACPDGANFQCSGGTLIRSENGIALTSSGVQAYGMSTSDLANPIIVKTSASGFAPASGGLAEIRVAKDSNGTISSPVMLLSKLGLSWDGKTDRPLIIETFSTTQGRTSLTSGGAVVSSGLPASSDLSFYDFATLGTAGTQANYANNRYFPRATPSRCAPDVTICPTTESAGVTFSAGDWRSGGTSPDIASASRLHEDGDIHAGDGPNGTILVGGNGNGVPFPGSKGYRGLDNWSLQYTNLGAWVTQDTVLIEEWSGLGNEHNKNRRGVVAYGAVTDPASVPTSGSVTYSGIAYGWYAPNRTVDPSPFRGTATITVNFATRQATVSVQNALSYDASGAPVPVSFTTATGLGAAGASVANYLTGAVTSGNLSGGIGGRLFGPVVSTGAGTGPAEVGGSFQLSNASATAVGGFLARKQ